MNRKLHTTRRQFMHIHFMRHGETNYNVLGLCNDAPSDKVHLTENGLRQAAAAAQTLKDTPIDLIIVSELPRTRQTADVINQYHAVDISVHPAINDIRTGFNDRPAAEHRRAVAHDRLHAKAPGGESIMELKQRVLPFIDWLKTLNRRGVLVVSHEEPLRVCMAHFRGLSDHEMLDVAIGNCQIFDFELPSGA